HALVSEAIDEVDFFHGFGGTAIGDAIATAVQVGLRSAGVNGTSVSALSNQRELASYVAETKRPSSTLVSILFLSDGHQTRGVLRPLQGAEDRKSTRLNSSHVAISYAVFCLKKKKSVLELHAAIARRAI